MQGQQRVALVVSVDPRVPAVPRGTETRVAPGGGVSTEQGRGSRGLMWLTHPLRAKCWVSWGAPHPQGGV